MRVDYLIEHVYTPYIRTNIIQMAWGLARNRKDRATLIALAWIEISYHPEGMTEDFYLHRAWMVMYRYYDFNIRSPDYIPRRPGDDKAVRMIRQRLRFFIKKVQKNGGRRVSSGPFIYGDKI